jgi:hypothetical protein
MREKLLQREEQLSRVLRRSHHVTGFTTRKALLQWEFARTEWLEGFSALDAEEPRQRRDASVDDTTSESGNDEGPVEGAESV